MPRRRRTRPEEALAELQLARQRPFWRTPALRLTMASIVIVILMTFFELKLNPHADDPHGDKTLTPADLDNATQYFTRAKIYLDNQRPSEAVSDYDHVIQNNPRSFLAWQGRAQAHQSMGDYQTALKDYTQALALRPESMEALNNRGLLYLQQNKPRAALQDYQAALKLHPDSALLYANRGLALEASGNSAAALKDFKQAQNLNPDYELAYYFEGNFWLHQKKFPAAEKAYLKALKRNPERVEAILNIGLAKKYQRRCTEAQNDFKLACQLGSKQACTQKCP